jgi:hypothetical protein
MSVPFQTEREGRGELASTDELHDRMRSTNTVVPTHTPEEMMARLEEDTARNVELITMIGWGVPAGASSAYGDRYVRIGIATFGQRGARLGNPGDVRCY